jgi:hypothetical protein
MKATIVAALLALAATGCSSIDDNRIVPGERIGPVVIGMSAKDLLDTLGTPSASTKLPGRTLNEFDGLAVVVGDADLRVISVGTSDFWYATDAGVRAGSSEFEVRAQLPGTPQLVEDRKNASIKTLCYPGMEVDFWPQQRGAAAVRVTNLPCLKQY